MSNGDIPRGKNMQLMYSYVLPFLSSALLSRWTCPKLKAEFTVSSSQIKPRVHVSSNKLRLSAVPQVTRAAKADQTDQESES